MAPTATGFFLFLCQLPSLLRLHRRPPSCDNLSSFTVAPQQQDESEKQPHIPQTSNKADVNSWSVACRMVRQDSRLWDDLHQGVLTTGKLNASLGFYESRAAKRLGIGGSFVSHRPLLSAYHHLMDGVYTPPTSLPRLFPDVVGPLFYYRSCTR